MFAYLGFEQADQLAAEIKNPQKNLPRAILLATFIGIVIYVMLQVVFIGAMPSSQIAHGWAKISNPDILAGPFAGLAGVVGLAWLAVVLRIDAFVSPFGTGLMYQTSELAGRLRPRPQPLLPAGHDQGRRERHPVGQPARRVRGRAVLPAAVPQLALPGQPGHRGQRAHVRRRAAGHGRVPPPGSRGRPALPGAGCAVISPLAFIIANMLIYWSGFETVWKLGVVIIIGYVLIGVFMAFDENRPPLDWKSAQWLPFYLIGIGIISWQGQYSGGAVAAPLNTNRIPFWWDMLVVAAFSLVIYYWAMATRLPKAEMLNLVERQSGIEPPERTAA